MDDASLTLTGVIAGTPQFMSPEQASGGLIDARSDLFSLGCVLYAMCVGHSPFRAATTVGVIRKVCDSEPRPIRDLNADIPDWLCEIIGCLLEKNPADRFQTAEEVAILLERWLAHVQQPLGNQPPHRQNPASRSPTGGPANAAASALSVTAADAAKDIAARCVAGIDAFLSRAGRAAHRRISPRPEQAAVHNPTASAEAWIRWYHDCRTEEPELVWKGVSWTPVRFALLCALTSAIVLMLLCPGLTEPVRTMLASSAGWCLSIPLRRILCAARNGRSAGSAGSHASLPVPPGLTTEPPATESVNRQFSRWVALSVRRCFDALIGRFPVIGEAWLRDAGIVVGPALMLAAAGAIIEAAASADRVALFLPVGYLTWLLLTFLQARIHGSSFVSVHLMLWCVAGFGVLVSTAILHMILITADAAIPVLMVTGAVGIAVVSFCRSVGEQAGLLPTAGLFNPERMATESGGVGSPANPVSDFPNMVSDDVPGRSGRASSLDSISAARPSAAAAPPAIPEFVRGASSQTVVTHRRAPFRAGILWAKLFTFPTLASLLLILRLQRGSWEWSGNGVLQLQCFVALSGFLYLTLISSASCLVTNSDGGFRRSPGVVRAGITSLVLALVTSLVVAAAVASTVWEWSTRGGTIGASPWPGLDDSSDLSLGIVLVLLTLSPSISSAFRALAGSADEVLSDLGGWLAACVVSFGSVLLVATTAVVFWLVALQSGPGTVWRDPFLFGG